MDELEKLDCKLRRTGGGLFHDSRADAVLLAKVINAMHDKINELVDEVNQLKKLTPNPLREERE